jgi:hypothetical protein
LVVVVAPGLVVEPAAAPVVPMEVPVLLDWLVQLSEIELIETTCNEPSDACVPTICTWCASFGFSVVLSPLTLIVWPLSDASVQLPPDCFRQPVTVVWPLAPLVAVEDGL